MEPIFEARCNCLCDSNNISAENLDRLAKTLNSVGVYFDPTVIVSSVERVGNWVGGYVSVFEDRIVFSMNKLNAKFQVDDSDLVIPTSMVSNVSFGKMLFIVATVDCDFMNAKLRFRCNGKNNMKLLSALTSVTITA